MEIYRATLTIYVAADSPIGAQIAATHQEEEYTAWEVEHFDDVNEVDPNWLNSIPWTESGAPEDWVADRYVKTILEATDASTT